MASTPLGTSSSARAAPPTANRSAHSPAMKKTATMTRRARSCPPTVDGRPPASAGVDDERSASPQNRIGPSPISKPSPHAPWWVSTPCLHVPSRTLQFSVDEVNRKRHSSPYTARTRQRGFTVGSGGDPYRNRNGWPSVLGRPQSEQQIYRRSTD